MLKHDIENQPEDGVVTVHAVKKDLPDLVDLPEFRNLPAFEDRAWQGCFICLESHKHGRYAALVPCQRPTKHRRVIRRHRKSGTDDWQSVYEDMVSWNNACESDTDIYQRMVDICYQHSGRWKRWLPYYGIIAVKEVNFCFEGVVGRDGRYPIHMQPIDVASIYNECKRIIAKRPPGPSFRFNKQCDIDYHSDKCLDGRQQCARPDYKSIAQEAKERCKQILFLPRLKECARDPAKANSRHTLEGLAQDSCIYDIRGPDRISIPLPDQRFRKTELMRGLHFVLGWQTDRVGIELPFRVSCVWLGIAAIWLCLVLWRGSGGDWGTAFAFAQVVAASIAIGITYIRSS